jgi:hypothetical protein
MIRKIFAIAVLSTLFSAVFAGDSGVAELQSINKDSEARVNQALVQCAEQFGVSVSGPAMYVNLEDTSAAIMPATGVDQLTRADFADWQILGVAILVGPDDAENPSGTFLVQAQAKAGTTQGCYQFVDANGVVVQEGDLTLEEQPDDKGTSGLKAALGGDAQTKAWYCGYPYYPWFRIYPRYWWGTWYWYYRWPWGYLRFRYYWWPYNCCGSWYWWWRWRC